jgi:hypothetical protein
MTSEDMCIRTKSISVKWRKTFIGKTWRDFQVLKPLIKLRIRLIKGSFGRLCAKISLFTYQGVQEFAESLIKFLFAAGLA